MLCQELGKHKTAVTTPCISQPGLLLACFERIKSLIIWGAMTTSQGLLQSTEAKREFTKWWDCCHGTYCTDIIYDISKNLTILCSI